MPTITGIRTQEGGKITILFSDGSKGFWPARNGQLPILRPDGSRGHFIPGQMNSILETLVLPMTKEDADEHHKCTLYAVKTSEMESSEPYLFTTVFSDGVKAYWANGNRTEEGSGVALLKPDGTMWFERWNCHLPTVWGRYVNNANTDDLGIWHDMTEEDVAEHAKAFQDCLEAKDKAVVLKRLHPADRPAVFPANILSIEKDGVIFQEGVIYPQGLDGPQITPGCTCDVCQLIMTELDRHPAPLNAQYKAFARTYGWATKASC